MIYTLVKDNNLRVGPLYNQNIQKSASDVIEETEAEFERNYNKIMCDTSYKSPMINKDVLTIKDLVYYESDEHVDTICDSSKQIDASNNPIKDTHIVKGVNNLSVGVVPVDPAIIGIGIIRQGITQGVIKVGTNIGSNLVTNVLTNSGEILLDKNTFQLNTPQIEAY